MIHVGLPSFSTNKTCSGPSTWTILTSHYGWRPVSTQNGYSNTRDMAFRRKSRALTITWSLYLAQEWSRPKLPDDIEEEFKTKWRGWQFKFPPWNFLSTWQKLAWWSNAFGAPYIYRGVTQQELEIRTSTSAWGIWVSFGSYLISRLLQIKLTQKQ